MRSEPHKTFATLRFAGDRLDPRQITNFLKITPTQAYAKGEKYLAGSRSGVLQGRTGVWFLSTDKAVSSSNLVDHLDYLITMFQIRREGQAFDGTRLTYNLSRLRKLMREYELSAKVTCFWYGIAGSKEPSIPRHFVETFGHIDAEIETDFDTDDSPIERLNAGNA
jgi:hypothetical protein